MYFRKAFCGDMYSTYIFLQHPERWKEYSEFNYVKKSFYFKYNAPLMHRNTIKLHFGGSQVFVKLFVYKGIVDVIVGDMKTAMKSTQRIALPTF